MCGVAKMDEIMNDRMRLIVTTDMYRWTVVCKVNLITETPHIFFGKDKK